MAGRSKAEIVSAIKAAFQNKQLPNLESGAMAYMMSKSAYLTDEGDHNGPHLMFFTPVKDSKDWGSGAVGSPVVSSPYWFISPKGQSSLSVSGKESVPSLETIPGCGHRVLETLGFEGK